MWQTTEEACLLTHNINEELLMYNPQGSLMFQFHKITIIQNWPINADFLLKNNNKEQATSL